MKISEQHIIDAAQRLRDEQNNQLHVRPWRRARFRVPGWLVAVPAAAFAGFVFGLYVSERPADAPQLTARADTVYIEVPATPTEPLPAVQETKAAPPAHREKTSPLPPTGRSVAEDDIRYDLLVCN